MIIICLNKDIFNYMEKFILDGIVFFKMYMVYDGMKVDDGIIYRVLKKVRDLGCIVGFYCENGDLLDVLIEENI